jgi:hypothetical protein
VKGFRVELTVTREPGDPCLRGALLKLPERLPDKFDAYSA